VGLKVNWEEEGVGRRKDGGSRGLLGGIGPLFANLIRMGLLYFCCTFFKYWLKILNLLLVLNDRKI
jgi:hypothetical protein